MINIIAFTLLSTISLFFLIYTYWKKKNIHVFSGWLFIAGISYAFEFVVLIVFNGYEYHPNILENRFHDTILGTIVSQGITIPAFGVFIAGFQLRFIWILLFSGLFMGIEEIFIALDLYHQYWWKTIYTGLFLISAFAILKKWYTFFPNLQQKKILWFITLLFLNIPISLTISWFLSAVFQLYTYDIGWFKDFDRDHTAFLGVYCVFTSIIYTMIALSKEKRAVTFTLLIGFLFLIDWGLFKYGILTLSENWSLFYFLLFHIFSALTYVYMDKQFFLKEDVQKVR